MCGINGFSWPDQELVKKMNNKVKHRGPDGDSFFTDENISLGHTRLAILDLSEKAKQPMVGHSGRFIIVFNGEIYNFQEIKKELEGKGHKFISTSDTEALINAWQEWGPDCLNKLNGIFAFAIWDKDERKLFLARDRLGVKPLYYYHQNNKLIFSSEIKAILEHPVERKVNLEALNHYFRLMYVPAPLTMFANIFKLEPASYLIYHQDKIEIKKYWEIDLDKIDNLKNEKEAIAKIRELVASSVQYQKIADRPVGIFLSGGIDSTSVLGNFRKYTSGAIKTFSVGFKIDDPNEKFNKDFQLARETAKHYQTNHHELMVSGQDYLNNLEKVAYHLDEPIANTAQVATYLLAGEAKKEVAVVLGGDGGDELFGGYERYALSKLVSFYQKLLPPALRSNVSLIISLIIGEDDMADKISLKPGSERYGQFMFQKEKNIVRILNQGVNQEKITAEFFTNKFFNKINKDFERQFMLTDIQSWLVDESLMRTDKTTMAFGLEYRVPILDHRLVELSAQIPTGWKIRIKEGKMIFKKAMKEFLPAHVVESAKKKVWLPPASEWLRTDLKEFAQNVLSKDYADTSEFINLDEVNKMFDEHCERKAYYLDLLWAVLMFQLWHKNYITN